MTPTGTLHRRECDENIMNTAIFRHGKYLSRMPPKSLDRNEFSTLLEAIVDKRWA